jgi:hypothetical protein
VKRLAVPACLAAGLVFAEPAHATEPLVPESLVVVQGLRIRPRSPGWDFVLLCPEVRVGPECEDKVEVSVVVDSPVVDRMPRHATSAEWNRRKKLDRWPRVIEEHLRMLEHARAPMEAGVEPEPVLEWQVKHELLEALVDLTGERSIRRTSQNQSIPQVERIRGVQNVVDLERAHRRATYIEIEEFKGNENDTTNGPLAMLGGFALMGTGIALDVAIDDPPKDMPHVNPRPKFWHPGIRLKGRF